MTSYEIRLFERKVRKTYHYDIYMRKKDSAKKKKNQFSCTLKLQDGNLHLVPEKRHGCFYQNSLWNKTNYIELSKALFAWFISDVKTSGAYSTEENTNFWHLKDCGRLGNRYTLYDCSLLFVKRNLEMYRRFISQMN